MIDKRVSDKSVYFELSIGNAGNSIDGHNESQCNNVGDDGELETVDSTAFNSTTNSCKPISHDKLHYYLPYWDYKPCMHVRCHFPDLRRRMYNSNMIAKLIEATVSFHYSTISTCTKHKYMYFLDYNDFRMHRMKVCTKPAYFWKMKTLVPRSNCVQH